MSRKPDPDEARRFLERYRPAAIHAALLKERLTRLRERATAPPSQKLDGMPHAKGATADKTADLAARILDTEQELAAAQEEADRLRVELRREINALPTKTENDIRRRELLTARYLDAENWGTICWCLFGQESDFEDEDRRESYQRRTFKLHTEALQSLSKIMEE